MGLNNPMMTSDAESGQAMAGPEGSSGNERGPRRRSAGSPSASLPLLAVCCINTASSRRLASGPFPLERGPLEFSDRA
jgi:hypothetical protein